MDDLRFFQVVASSESLTAAARELGCSLPVVSKRLGALERRLDVRLVHRGPRRLALTPEGRSTPRAWRRSSTRSASSRTWSPTAPATCGAPSWSRRPWASDARTSRRCSASSPPGIPG
ncbi:LysR family transcriptional regulator [Nonomuraea rubra]|uniref:helix-turn-helix domain-containing protein n=1 Tax=Nonomuraea rubra TaxID=46180 RepID=UPI00362196B9